MTHATYHVIIASPQIAFAARSTPLPAPDCMHSTRNLDVFVHKHLKIHRISWFAILVARIGALLVLHSKFPGWRGAEVRCTRSPQKQTCGWAERFIFDPLPHKQKQKWEGRSFLVKKSQKYPSCALVQVSDAIPYYMAHLPKLHVRVFNNTLLEQGRFNIVTTWSVHILVRVKRKPENVHTSSSALPQTQALTPRPYFHIVLFNEDAEKYWFSWTIYKNWPTFTRPLSHRSKSVQFCRRYIAHIHTKNIASRK